MANTPESARRSGTRLGLRSSSSSPRASERSNPSPRNWGFRRRTRPQHLQVLRGAGLVDSRRAGLFIHYRLADDSIVPLSTAIRTVAERRLADLERLVRDEFKDRSVAEEVSLAASERGRRSDVVILDTRPSHEYRAGHIPGALSVPVDELQRHLRQLPKKGKEFVAYCRGPYCVYCRSRGGDPEGQRPTSTSVEGRLSGMESRRVPG